MVGLHDFAEKWFWHSFAQVYYDNVLQALYQDMICVVFKAVIKLLRQVMNHAVEKHPGTNTSESK